MSDTVHTPRTSSNALDVLLEETRLRYKAEHERHAQVYTRLGVYIVVLAIYGNALVRFLDRPPPPGNNALDYIFWASAGLTVVAAVAAFGCLIVALAFGRGAAYSPNPGVWNGRADELREFVRQRFTGAGQAEPAAGAVEDGVAAELKQDFLTVLQKAADHNIEENARRFGWLFRAGALAAVGAIPFFIASGSYLLMVMARPREPETSAVRMMGPVVVDFAATTREVCVSNDKPAAPPPKPASPPSQAVRPPPPPVRIIKDGAVPKKPGN